MAEVLLSCEMLEDEMQLALQRTGVQMPIVWLDAGLHEYPAKLRASLREKIAELEQSYDTILLGFCLCGNAMDGVGASRARLVVPRFDDCIRMLMSRDSCRRWTATVSISPIPGQPMANFSPPNTMRPLPNTAKRRASASIK